MYRIFPQRNSILDIFLQSSTKCQCHDTCTQHVCPARRSDRSCSTLGGGTRGASLLAGKVVESNREETTAKLSFVAHTRKRAVGLGQLRRQSREIVAAPAPVDPNQYGSMCLSSIAKRTPWNIPGQRIGSSSRRSTACMRLQWCHCRCPSFRWQERGRRMCLLCRSSHCNIPCSCIRLSQRRRLRRQMRRQQRQLRWWKPRIERKRLQTAR
jgi:hypothetical protein